MEPVVYIIVPVHNRCATTLHGLEHLRQTGVLAWARVVIVDDGSTDDTAARVTAAFPEVHVLAGDGTLWWAGATVKGMRFAVERGATHVVWLNDDCLPRPGTLQALVEQATARNGPTVAQAITPSGLCYGGWIKTRMWFDLVRCGAQEIKACQTFSGNCVCLPRAVVDRIGYPDAAAFPHYLADADFGLRAGQAGFQSSVIGAALCDNADNPGAQSWLLDPIPLRMIARSFTTPKGLYYFPAYYRFCWRHWGFWGLAVWMAPYLRFLAIAAVRLVLPPALIRWLYGTESRRLRALRWPQNTDSNT